MIDLTDGLLNAFLDGELDPETEQSVAAALRENPGARLRIDRMRAADIGLRDAYPTPPEHSADPLVDRILSAPAPFQAQVRLSTRRRIWLGLTAIAAGVAGLMIGEYVTLRPTELKGQSVLALDDRAQAVLNSSSSGALDARTQIRVSFTLKSEDGRYCRQFNSPKGEGLACLNEGEWTMTAWDAAGARSQIAYEMAGASSLIDDAVDRLQAETLDLAAESAAIRNDWR